MSFGEGSLGYDKTKKDKKRERRREGESTSARQGTYDASTWKCFHLISSHRLPSRQETMLFAPYIKEGKEKGLRVVVRDDRRGSSKSERELHIRQGSPITNVPEQTVEPGGAGNYRNQRQRAKRERWGGEKKKKVS